MNIKELFNKDESITIEKYLDKCGVENVNEYLSASEKDIEDYHNYDNMEKGCNMLGDMENE